MTLTRTLALAALTAGIVSLVGCGAQPGTTLISLEKGQAETLDEDGVFTTAPNEGIVALYGSNDLTPNIRFPVDEGDEVGFRADEEEGLRRIIAVAGENEREIDQGTVFDRTYYWKYQDEE